MPKRKLTPEQRQEAIRRYAEGESPKAIGLSLGISGPGVSWLAKRAGVQPQLRLNSSGEGITAGHKGLSKETRQQIADDYADSSDTIEQLALKWGVSYHTIRRYAEEFGVVGRNRPPYSRKSQGLPHGKLQKYNLREHEFEHMRQQQQNKCAICGKEPSDDGRSLGVDHCHTTGVIRGLLCLQCNTGLGMFADDPQRLRTAAVYLLLPRDASKKI